MSKEHALSIFLHDLRMHQLLNKVLTDAFYVIRSAEVEPESKLFTALSSKDLPPEIGLYRWLSATELVQRPAE